ncbi:transporter substrate-binding domain-containing protein [Endozoicomonas sp. SM1973]|uniref:Transporter substrate-binding domain-containing protein n=1 Tax=Spartinivicinus marinus TaxID=2994442 RepID=A0A853ICA7_9GAMM|nr:transporter substrate-binding domain-containing protein [Spartinivicinus marinus]MCX4028589.1 transporter substrate-binding domain-containing protein [Spartinivicinus marinus]NYZ67147.1 transporter substrate-binding domain-containing protein [Spartinivicinus marinus]
MLLLIRQLFIKRLFITVFFIAISNQLIARQLIIGGIPEIPIRYIDDDGKLVGIDVDIIDRVFKQLNLDYKVVIISSSSRLEQLWKTGKTLDMVFTYSYKKWRTKYLIYPKESHITTQYHFFILRKNMGKIKYDTFSDLKGLKMGMTEGFSYTPEFLQAAESGVFYVDKVPINDLHMKKLLLGRIDIVPLPTMVTLYEAKVGNYRDKISYLPKPVKDKPYYNTFVKASTFPIIEELIPKYDRILKQMKENGEVKAIFAKYGVD